jgi:hypothetical protein
LGNRLDSFGQNIDQGKQGRDQYERVVVICQRPGTSRITQIGEQRPQRQREGQFGPGQGQRWVEAQT